MTQYDIIEQLPFQPQRVVATFPVREEARHEADILRSTFSAKKAVYTVSERSDDTGQPETPFQRFIHLVADVRYLQAQFWHDRTAKSLRAAMALEARLDQYIEHCHEVLREKPQYKPQPVQKAYFDLVREMRIAQGTFHQYRKEPQHDKSVATEMLRKARDIERLVDATNKSYLAPHTSQ